MNCSPTYFEFNAISIPLLNVFSNVEEYMMFGENGPVRTLLDPFISQPIGYDRFLDVTLKNGKKTGGGSVYTESDDLSTKFYKSFMYVLEGVAPGVITSGMKIEDAIAGDLKAGGRPALLMDELLALLAGTRIIRIDVKKDLPRNNH